MNLKLNEEKKCPNCGSSSKNNIELKAYRKKNELIELEHDKYLELNNIIMSQNTKNTTFDKIFTHKYWYAKLILLLSFILPIVPTIILSFVVPYTFIKIFLEYLTYIIQFAVYIFGFYILFVIFLKNTKKH